MFRPLVIAAALVGMALGVPLALGASSLPQSGSGTLAVYVPGNGDVPTQPRYQGNVAFNASGTGGLRNPRVWVACYQNGTSVYGAGGSPTSSLRLGGDMSQWVLNGGGAASCTADLYYILNARRNGEWNGKGAQGGFVYLAHTAFDAAG